MAFSELRHILLFGKCFRPHSPLRVLVVCGLADRHGRVSPLLVLSCHVEAHHGYNVFCKQIIPPPPHPSPHPKKSGWILFLNLNHRKRNNCPPEAGVRVEPFDGTLSCVRFSVRNPHSLVKYIRTAVHIKCFLLRCDFTAQVTAATKTAT